MALVHDATPDHQDASSSALAEGALLLVFVGLPRSGKPWRPFPQDTSVPGQIRYFGLGFGTRQTVLRDQSLVRINGLPVQE